ncbi:penicillin-binding protein [Actinomadura sp. PM05-2]|uniref:Penicillin-binding protein n=1 Tax=Actinomadura parmotrematis TaxID=2864039 RepID=A0ABS7G3W0_9ACTN|nr:penicillin-binding protein [Actinomadura parmotrematis]
MFVLAAALFVFVVYQSTPIPKTAQASATAEESVIKYRDGKTAIARVGMRREIVDLDDIPKMVRNAVLAAEDRNFETEPGVSPKGVTRALFKTATGGDVQGGSTITQQLARNYYAGLSQERSLSRKFKEIFISMRMGKEMEKNTILGLYLNTVYFGRQSYGIQAAARAYFRTDVKHLTPAQAAMLAAMIQRPNYFATTAKDSDPRKKALVARWNYVLDGMVTKQWLTASDRAKQKFPKTERQWSDVTEKGQAGYLKQRVLSELESRYDINEQQLDQGGYTITTTFDADLTKAAGDVVASYKKAHNLNAQIRFGLAAVTPDGEVRAAYGGPDYIKQPYDNSFNGAVAPGSSFKPIVLATALSKGYSLETSLDGSYKRTINQATFTNDSRSENGVYNLVTMTQHSINTAYVDLGQRVGLDNVVDMAEKMGFPPSTKGLNATVTSLPLGPIDVSSVNMASVYSTFAAEGEHTPVHVIAKVVDRSGKEIKRPLKTTRVFSADVSANATKAMRAVVTGGTGTAAALPDRPVAGKTGTTDENKSAWFVGFTPKQLATSVSMWSEDKKGNRQSLKGGLAGYSQIYGGTVPAEIFKLFMMKALAGKAVQPLPVAPGGGTIPDWSAKQPTPTPTPTPTRTPSCAPGQQSTPDEPCEADTSTPTVTPSMPTSSPTSSPTTSPPTVPCTFPGQQNCTPTNTARPGRGNDNADSSGQ